MILGYSEENLKEIKAIHTATEINQQPTLWMEAWQIVKDNEEKIKNFLQIAVDNNTKIILTGAGTSDYVGNIAKVRLQKILDNEVCAIPTTDIVSNPYDYIKEDRKTLLISFGRSGNSPESVGAIDVMSKNIKNLYQLVITCNKDGKLATASNTEKDLVLNMPEKSNDASFAMTSSFSCMLLSTLLSFDIENIDKNKQFVEAIVKQGNEILTNKQDTIKEIVNYGCDRVVYLGSSDIKELCKEMALKNLELTSGKVITVCEGSLGFRHGPKSIINDNTLIIMMLSPNDHTSLYEMDLVNEIYNDAGEHKIVVMDYHRNDDISDASNLYIPVDGEDVPNEYKVFNYMLLGQMFSFYSALRADISPDNPRPDGTVNRVVQGVTLYKYN